MDEREWVLMVELPCRAPMPEDAIAWFRAECEAGRRVLSGRGGIRAVRHGRPLTTVDLKRMQGARSGADALAATPLGEGRRREAPPFDRG